MNCNFMIVLCVVLIECLSNGLANPDTLDDLSKFDDPDHHNHHHHSNTYPKKRNTGAVKKEPGENMDRGLGFKGKGTKNKGPKKTIYPWDSSRAEGKVRVTPTKTMKSFEKPEEEPFPEGFYDDYDFEFPKGMKNNKNFETKIREVYEYRMKMQRKEK